MPLTRPVILVVDDRPDRFRVVVDQLARHAGGRLAREFEFIHLDCYEALRQWYVRCQARFVSLIVLGVDFGATQDRNKVMPVPPEWQPVPPDFDELSLQGVIIYNLLRNDRVDTIAPVLFVTSFSGIHRTRDFAEYVVHPGYGACAFLPEDAAGERYFPELIRSIDEIALRPLNREKRAEWRQMYGMAVGKSRRMAHVCYEIERMAPSDAIVLLMGEPGVGKEMVARAIHRKSPRYDKNDPTRERPWTVNIAALEKNLVEDELFGHLRGAYTDASTSRMGIFEAAQGSTVFLDEIGDLGSEVQLKLLRVMEYKEIKKLGSSQEMHVDNRIIAATNRTPQDIFQSMRPDFIGRLVQHCLIVPGLRNRWEGDAPRIVEDDVQELIDYFVGVMNHKLPVTQQLVMSDVAVRFLTQSIQEYVTGNNEIFTNNIRTIRNIVERAFERAQAQRRKEITLGEVIATLGMIKLIHRQVKPIEVPVTIERIVGSLQLDAVERRAIVEAINKTGSISATARLLGLHRDTLRYKMNAYGITEELADSDDAPAANGERRSAGPAAGR